MTTIPLQPGGLRGKNELWALIASLIALFAVMRLWLNKHVVQASLQVILTQVDSWKMYLKQIFQNTFMTDSNNLVLKNVLGFVP